jgi:large subunit ribosomal protein L24
MASKQKSLSKARRALKIHKNDIVEVITGSDRSKQGKVLRTIPGRNLVVVQNVNQRWKHLRRSQDAPSGGRLQREQPIAVSNVKFVSRPAKDA